MLKRILNHKSIIKKPPVIIDLGASGEINKEWKKFYPYSIFLSLDGDKRKFDNFNQNFKKHYRVQTIVDTMKKRSIFYLTKSPYCSSLLKPNKKNLSKWFFENKFKIIKKQKVKTSTLFNLLKERKLKYVDIVKVDLQGVDLKIYESLPKQIRNKIKYVELEPGLYEFYEKENDRVPQVMNKMSKDFFIENISFGKHIKGNLKNIQKFSKIKKKLINITNKKSISYLNISFLSNFEKQKYNERDTLIYLAILLLKKRYAEIFDILNLVNFKDEIFQDIKKYCEIRIILSSFTYFLLLPFFIFKKIFNKF